MQSVPHLRLRHFDEPVRPVAPTSEHHETDHDDPELDAHFRAANAFAGRRNLLDARERLLRLNRRAATPFSSRRARSGPLAEVADQIRIVSQLIDAELVSERMSDGDTPVDVARLLEMQAEWTTRLEDQIWRQESAFEWQQSFADVFDAPHPSGAHFRDVCEQIRRETVALPSAAMLLPEPGLPLVDNVCAARGSSRPVGFLHSIEAARFMSRVTASIADDQVVPVEPVLAAAVSCLSDQHRDRLNGLQRLLVDDLSLVLDTEHPGIASPAFVRFDSNELKVVPDVASEEDREDPSARLIHTSMVALSPMVFEWIRQIDRASSSAPDHVVLPALERFYSAVAQRFVNSYAETDQRLAQLIVDASGLGCDATEDSDAERDDRERLLLPRQLRRHLQEPADCSEQEPGRLVSDTGTHGRMRRPFIAGRQPTRRYAAAVRQQRDRRSSANSPADSARFNGLEPTKSAPE